MSLYESVVAGTSAVTWAHTYAPKLWFGAPGTTSLVPLPTPLMTANDQASNVVTYSDVPLMPGVVLHAAKRGARTVSFSGIIYSNIGKAEDVRYVADRLEGYLIETGNVQDMSVFTHYDASSGNYRWYEKVKCTSFSVDWGSRTTLYVPYAFTILVPDGLLHENIGSTGEGGGS